MRKVTVMKLTVNSLMNWKSCFWRSRWQAGLAFFSSQQVAHAQSGLHRSCNRGGLHPYARRPAAE